MLDFQFHPEADREADHEFDYLRIHGGDIVASRFLDALEHAIHSCRSHPLLYRMFDKNIRRVILHKPFGEYCLPFVVLDKTIYILAVAHAKRKPFYWRDRLGDTKSL